MYVDQNDMPITMETTKVKHSKADVRGKARPALDVRFEPQNPDSLTNLSRIERKTKHYQAVAELA